MSLCVYWLAATVYVWLALVIWEPVSAGGISVEPAGYRYLISANLATAWNLGPPTVRHPLNMTLEAGR